MILKIMNELADKYSLRLSDRVRKKFNVLLFPIIQLIYILIKNAIIIIVKRRAILNTNLIKKVKYIEMNKSY